MNFWVSFSNSKKNPVLVFYCHCNKSPHALWLETAQTYLVQLFRSGDRSPGPKPRCWQGCDPRGLREKLSPAHLGHWENAAPWGDRMGLSWLFTDVCGWNLHHCGSYPHRGQQGAVVFLFQLSDCKRLSKGHLVPYFLPLLCLLLVIFLSKMAPSIVLKCHLVSLSAERAVMCRRRQSCLQWPPLDMSHSAGGREFSVCKSTIYIK